MGGSMIVRPKDFLYDFDEQQKTHKDLIEWGWTEEQVNDYLLDRSFIKARGFFNDIHSLCFCCGESLKAPLAMWNGHNEHLAEKEKQIWMHRKCCENMILGLTNDVEQLKREEEA
jgi:DNA-directed RNA polymerase subunit N (RpoN/RPB10)